MTPNIIAEGIMLALGYIGIAIGIAGAFYGSIRLCWVLIKARREKKDSDLLMEEAAKAERLKKQYPPYGIRNSFYRDWDSQKLRR